MDEQIGRAIGERRLIAFSYDGCARTAEPHDFGITGRQKKLFYYQVGGASRSGRPLGWRWAVLGKISGLRVLEARFPGPRPAPSGRHHRWDRLIASVSRVVDPSGATRS